MFLFCRNKVKDYEKWRARFDADADAHEKAGLTLTGLWRAEDNPNDVFFLFNVKKLADAKSFIDAPDATKQAEKSGVLEGEYHFVKAEILY